MFRRLCQALVGFAAVVATTTIAVGALAQDVTIVSKDGLNSITGEIISFEDERFVLRTSVGDIAIAADLVDCIGDACPDVDALEQVIRVAGPEALLADLMPEFLQSYAETNEAKILTLIDDDGNGVVDLYQDTDLLVTFESAPNSPEDAFAALLSGDVEIVLSDRRISRSEIDAFLDAGLGDLSSTAREAIVAQDGIVPLISGDLPLPSLGVGELTEILAGNVTNWSELGGPDAPVNVYLPGDEGTLAQTIEFELLEPEFLSFTPEARRLPLQRDVEVAVAEDPGGIGLTTLSERISGSDVALVDTCGLPLRHSSFAVKSEDYPFSRRIYMYTADRANPSRTLKFVEHAQEYSAEAEFKGPAFMGLQLEMASLGDHGDQLAYALVDPEQASELQNLRGFARAVLGAERLSITFRFGEGSSQLDNKAILDASRLLSFMDREDFRDREILLVGFTDSVGASAVNEVLSQRRAEQVLETITAIAPGEIAPERFTALGFGAAYPVACNSSEAGRELNRRVEVWVR